MPQLDRTVSCDRQPHGNQQNQAEDTSKVVHASQFWWLPCGCNAFFDSLMQIHSSLAQKIYIQASYVKVSVGQKSAYKNEVQIIALSLPLPLVV